MQQKRSIVKKWWFWALIIIVLIAIGAGASQNDKGAVVNSNTSTDSKKTEEKTEFNVGETIAFDGKEVTVTEVERNWNSGNQFITPKAGKEYVKVNVKIENKSDKELSFNTFDWKMEDGNGSIEGPTGAAFTGDDSLGSGDLAAGGRKSGSVVFEVPKNSNLKIHYQPGFWSSKKIIITV